MRAIKRVGFPHNDGFAPSVTTIASSLAGNAGAAIHPDR